MTEFSLDWDNIQFRKFDRKARSVFRASLRAKIGRMDLGPLHLWYRKSSRGHLHVKVVSSRPLSQFEVFCLRLVMDDDRVRLRMDAFRALRGLGTNRLWDSKVKAGKTGRAGRWRAWATLR